MLSEQPADAAIVVTKGNHGTAEEGRGKEAGDDTAEEGCGIERETESNL